MQLYAVFSERKITHFNHLIIIKVLGSKGTKLNILIKSPASQNLCLIFLMGTQQCLKLCSDLPKHQSQYEQFTQQFKSLALVRLKIFLIIFFMKKLFSKDIY